LPAGSEIEIPGGLCKQLSDLEERVKLATLEVEQAGAERAEIAAEILSAGRQA
ncbi:hypothetical protein MNEG_11454, partial [Monoraphidium neglectum]